MPKTNFPFRTIAHATGDPYTPDGPQPESWAVVDPIEIDVPDLTGSPDVRVVLDATDIQGEHRIVSIEGKGLYSAVVTGADGLGWNGGRARTGFSAFADEQPVGSRILVGQADGKGVSRNDIPGFLRDDVDRSRTRFAERLEGIVSFDGDLYLPTPRVPVPKVVIDTIHHHVVLVNEDGTDQNLDGAALPWSMVETIRSVDDGFRLRTCDPVALGPDPHPWDWYVANLRRATGTFLQGVHARLSLMPLEHVRSYVGATDAFEAGNLSLAWGRAKGLTDAKGGPELTLDLVRVMKTLADLEPRPTSVDPERASDLLDDLYSEMEAWASALNGERVSLVRAMERAKNVEAPDDVMASLVELRVEAQDWLDALNGENEDVLWAVTQVDHFLTSPVVAPVAAKLAEPSFGRLLMSSGLRDGDLPERNRTPLRSVDF